MTELATLARPYAEAAFKRAKETGSSAKWSEMLAFLAAVARDSGISSIANNPKISKDRFLQLLLDIGGKRIDAEGVNFVKLLVKNGRISLLPLISGLFEERKAEDEGYVDVSVATAFALTKEEEQKLAASLKKMLKKTVNLNVEVDQSLIGGVLIRAGDRVIDGSIKGRIQQLAKRL
ncbi:MAG: F0F1 ATP synthase subunit delta [Gammaproteobacteria bacterium]